MRISDWSSDVFSSDLLLLESRVNLKFLLERGQQLLPTFAPVAAFLKLLEHVLGLLVILLQRIVDIHRFLRVAAHRSVFNGGRFAEFRDESKIAVALDGPPR